MSEILNNLPWQIQVSLASGYAAYLLAYRGIRTAHRSIDTTFITLVFGLIATAILTLLPNVMPLFAGALAFFCSCLGAIAWRRFLRKWLHRCLKSWKVTWSDDNPSALATLSDNANFPISQIAVELDDGTWLRCDHAARFSDTPFGPVTIGPSGDVALYLTHREAVDGTEKEVLHVRDPDWGDRITYIPASRIRQITIRHKR